MRLNRHIRYEPGDPCPPLVTLGVAFQGVVLVLANTVLMVTIIVRAAGEGELYLQWAVFAALIIAGVTTALQAAHVGRVGAGHILMTGAGPHFIAISVVALTERTSRRWRVSSRCRRCSSSPWRRGSRFCAG